MEKKMYYKVDNGDKSVICNLHLCVEILKSTSKENTHWDITIVWLSKDEYKKISMSKDIHLVEK